MYTRMLRPASKAFFLFGPRGTGKSTWSKQAFPGASRFDLLRASESLRFQKAPSEFSAEVRAFPKDRWVIVDEIQKVPALLDEIHSLMENDGYNHFVLTGSSARKLRRGAANLLAGRATQKSLFPLNSFETNFSLPPEQVLNFGLLPESVNAQSDEAREDYLNAYVETYLQEEIKAEALVKDVGSFARFVQVGALVAAQTTNVSGVARDAGVGRETVRGYFEVLEDTLLGSWLPAYRPRAKIKEIGLPKFYWFDAGVLRAAFDGFRQPLPSDYRGVLLEHWINHEMLSYMHYGRVKGSLGYWSTPSESKIDFLWWYGEAFVAIEVKAGKEFRSEFLKGITSFSQGKKLKRSFVVYLGSKEMKVGQTWIFPVQKFLKELYAGGVFGG
ncbi:MAG: ATP-binding protein [Deltaproteobacteria bacterium]|nr:ATP-binding protein [Deltaproteobacteria bacterium]MBI3293356.1 ATP-binding protein [Deltaproteobacteria bacterium]